jgi:hypothetical protein
MFIMTGVYYAYSYSSFETRIIAAQLETVTDYISSNIVDLVTLCALSNIDQLIIEGLEIPVHLNTTYFSITLVQVEDHHTHEELFSIRTYLDSKPTTLKEATLPWSTYDNLMIYNGTPPTIDHPTLHPQVTMSSSSESIVVWCLKSEGKTTIGLGNMGEDA